MEFNRLKYVLLIALFCYGQIIASVHVVSHLDTADCEADFNALSAECHAALHELSGSFSVAHHHDSQAHAEDSDHSDLDCVIYHVLLSHSGMESVGESVVALPSPLTADTAYRDEFIAGATRDYRRIRAPPVIS